MARGDCGGWAEPDIEERFEEGRWRMGFVWGCIGGGGGYGCGGIGMDAVHSGSGIGGDPVGFGA